MQIKTVVTLFLFLIITYSSFADSDTPTCVYTTLPKVHRSPCMALRCSSVDYTNAVLDAQKDDNDYRDASEAYYKTIREFNVSLAALSEIKGNFDGPLAHLTPIQDTYRELLRQVRELIGEETIHLGALEMCTTDECDRSVGMPDNPQLAIERVRSRKAIAIEKLKQTAAAWNSEISKLPKDVNEALSENSRIDLSAINEAQSKIEQARRKHRRVNDRVKSSVECTEDDQYICIGDVACTLRGVEYKIKGAYCSSDTKECPSVADECIDRPAQIVSDDGQKPQNGDKIIRINRRMKLSYDNSLVTDREAGGSVSAPIRSLQSYDKKD